MVESSDSTSAHRMCAAYTYKFLSWVCVAVRTGSRLSVCSQSKMYVSFVHAYTVCADSVFVCLAIVHAQHVIGIALTGLYRRYIH